jgi:hypothetical protein
MMLVTDASPPPAHRATAARQETVAADLSAIFAQDAAEDRANGSAGTAIQVVPPADAARRWRVRLAGLLLAGGVAVGGGYLIAGRVTPSIAAAQQETAAPTHTASRAPALPQPAASQVALAPAAAVTPDAVAVAPVVDAPSPLAAPSPAIATADRAVAASAPPRRYRLAPANRFADRRGPAPDDPCIGLRGARLDRCVQTTVPAAYADVRRAYNAARRAGVDSDYLGDVQRRWVRLQRRSSDNPYDLLDGYDDIRGELIDAVRRQRDGDY